MAPDYYSDREDGPRPRAQSEVNERAWGGLVSLIEATESTGGFGESFPEMCEDGRGVTGTDWRGLKLAVEADIPETNWPLSERTALPTPVVLDLIEFFHRHATKPIRTQAGYHGFYGHHHLTFKKREGQAEFREAVNTILARNGIAYLLRE